MPKPRGKEHTSLTETATIVVKILRSLPGVKMIAPGKISSTRRSTTGTRYLTAVYTTAGMELIITGQSTQKVAVHTTRDPVQIFTELTAHKRLQSFVSKERSRMPGNGS